VRQTIARIATGGVRAGGNRFRVAWGDDQPVETQIVDAMNKLFGMHPGFRANHAKGVVVEGKFKGLM
jgi:hypothetical protein